MKPHVVIIMADQLRYDALGRGFTPEIDSIGKEGARFERAYTSCPLCVPARGGFFTGMCPNKNGSLINPWEKADKRYGDVRQGVDNLYTLMEREWDSIHSGKQHLFTEGGKLEDRPDSLTRWCSTEKTYRQYLAENGKPAPGGERFRTHVPEMVDGKATKVSSYSNAETGCYEPGEKWYFDVYFADKAVEGIQERDPAKPLLLNAMFLAPHPPLQIPEPWYGKVGKAEVELPDNVGVYCEHQSPLQMYNLTGVVGAGYSREHWAEAWRVYLGLVSMLDRCVGRVLDELKRQGIYDESLIMFTSDHGEMLGSHALFQKMCMYEESVRTPVYVKFPASSGLHKGAVCQEPVSHLDILPTLCDYLGLCTGNDMDGQSLMPLLHGEKTGVLERDLFIQYDGNGSRSNFQRCVVSGNYKLIADIFKDEIYYELYDLEKDVQEMDNLMFQEEYDGRACAMAEALARHMKDTGDLLTLPELRPKEFREKYEEFSNQ